MSETATSTNSMEISFCVFREIEIDDNVDCLDVDTASEEIRAYKIAAFPVAEIVENSIARLLKHACMRVKAGVP